MNNDVTVIKQYLTSMGRGRERPSGGRGRGRGNGQYARRGNGPNLKKNDTKKEMKFVQYSAAKHNGVTYDTMKDHVLEIVKKTYKYGGDILLAMDDIKHDAENKLCTKTCGDIPQQKKKEETTDYDVAEYIEIKKEH